MQTLDRPNAPSQQPYPEPVYPRRPTRTVAVGNVLIGSQHPVVVQSMINEDTLDIDAAVAAIRRLHEAGSEIVRVTVPSMAHAKAMEAIRSKLIQTYKPVPLVADVHHNGIKIALEVAQYVDKVRINPGLFVLEKPQPGRTEYTQAELEAIRNKIRETFTPLVQTLKAQNKALRIGVNHGSLAERMLFMYGDTPEGMVESALEYAEICAEQDFHNVVLSFKASRPQVMLAAYRLAARRFDALGLNYPFHLGVTEAGDGEYGRIKSAVGIGTLLAEGIGDTIRVSLTEAPEKRDPGGLRHLAGPQPAQNHGGICGLPLLWPHPLQLGGSTAEGAGRNPAPGGPRHCRHGLHRQRAGGNGRRRLRLCGENPRLHLPLPRKGGGEEGARVGGRPGADRAHQSRWAVGGSPRRKPK